ncbi:uncharacterized protein F5147DRAFT_757110, partial [Suillus discolor]
RSFQIQSILTRDLPKLWRPASLQLQLLFRTFISTLVSCLADSCGRSLINVTSCFGDSSWRVLGIVRSLRLSLRQFGNLLSSTDQGPCLLLYEVSRINVIFQQDYPPEVVQIVTPQTTPLPLILLHLFNSGTILLDYVVVCVSW